MRLSSRKKSIKASLSSLKPSGSRNLSSTKWSLLNSSNPRTILRGLNSLTTSRRSLASMIRLVLIRRSLSTWLKLKRAVRMSVSPGRKPVLHLRRQLSKNSRNPLNLGRRAPRRSRKLGSKISKRPQNLGNRTPNLHKNPSRRPSKKPRKVGSNRRRSLM